MKFTSLNRTSLTFPQASPVGCLLIHGFTSTADEMAPLGRFLAQDHIHVQAPLLPGHGTTPEKLASVKWTDWMDCVRDAYFQLKNRCEKIFVGGQSMGGVLALHLASHYPVNGVMSYAAPTEFNHPFIRYLPLLKKFLRYYPKSKGNDIRDEAVKKSLPNYSVYPLPAIQEFMHLVHHVRADLAEITTPVLIMHSTQDHTIPVENAQRIFQSIRSTADSEKIILHNAYHLITVDMEKDIVYRKTLAFIRKWSKK